MTEGTCLDCHDPHGGETRTLLRTKTTRALCEQCHEGVVQGKLEHGPVAAGGCLACHTPHVSNHRKLLRKEPRFVCLDCHVVFAHQVKESRVVHQPMEKGCLPCHDPHASDEPKLLERPARELCLSCHEDIRSTLEHAKTQHGALMEGRECMNCHDAHATYYPRLLRNNPRVLCLGCHDREIEGPNGKIPDMSKVLAAGMSVHGPIAMGDCGACHQIHGGDLFRLLKKKYPSQFYASFREESYALCFSCHDPSLALVERTTRLTGFRNGDRNLHFLHVNQEKKGRTCRACHETHGSDREKHIRASVPFGNWMLPTGFTKTATGGSCTSGCHQRFSYDRENPVENEQRPEKSRGGGRPPASQGEQP